MTTNEPMTVARQLANLIGEDNTRTAIEAGWRAIRELNAGHTTPLVHPGVADYVAAAVILAAVEAGLADTGAEQLRAELEKVRGQYADTRRHNDLLTAELADQQRANATWANENAALRKQVDDLGMYKTRYFEIQELLDEVLGPNEEDGAGEGIVQDVHLLAAQRDTLRPVVEAAKEWAEAYVNPTVTHAGVAEAKLFEAVKALPNDQEPCDICSGYGCPDCRENEPIDPQGSGWTQGDNFHADREAEVAR